MDFGSRLKELRQKKKLTQEELGKMVGVHYTQIGRYERNKCNPTSEVLKQLASALTVTYDYLIEGLTKNPGEDINDRYLLQQFREVEAMEEEDRKVVKIFLDAFITKKHIQKFAQAPS